MVTLPANPLADANIFTLDDVQVTSVPVGCRNPYVRYASRKPLFLQTNLSVIDFSEVVRFPMLGFTHVTAMLWAVPPPGLPITGGLGYAHYYFAEKRDKAPVKPLMGGVVTIPYDVATEQTEVPCKELGLFIRIAAVVGTIGSIGLNFSVLVEP